MKTLGLASGCLLFLAACATPPISESLADDFLVLGNGFFELEKWPEAERFYRRALELKPYSPAVTFNLARVLIETGKLEESAALLTNLKRSEPDNTVVRKTLAYVLFWIGDKRAAFLEYQAVLELSPSDRDTLHNLGLVAAQINEDKTAARALEAWLEAVGTGTVPNSVWLALEGVYRRTEHTSGLKRALERLMLSQPGNPSRALELASILEKEENWTEAVARLVSADQILTVAGRPDPLLRWRIGEAYLLRLNQQDSALEWFGKAVESKFNDRVRAESLLARPELIDPEAIKAFFEEKGLLGEVRR